MARIDWDNWRKVTVRELSTEEAIADLPTLTDDNLIEMWVVCAASPFLMYARIYEGVKDEMVRRGLPVFEKLDLE